MTELYLLDCLGGHSVGKTDRPQTPFWGLEGLQYERGSILKKGGAATTPASPNFNPGSQSRTVTLLPALLRFIGVLHEKDIQKQQLRILLLYAFPSSRKLVAFESLF